MKMITAAQAAAFAGGTVVGDGNTQITGISTDSRSIPAGSLFIPIRGERFDGHDFLEKAVELQAAAVMSEKDIDLPVPVIRVPDTRAALLALAGGYRHHRLRRQDDNQGNDSSGCRTEVPHAVHAGKSEQ